MTRWYVIVSFMTAGIVMFPAWGPPGMMTGCFEIPYGPVEEVCIIDPKTQDYPEGRPRSQDLPLW